MEANENKGGLKLLYVNPESIPKIWVILMSHENKGVAFEVS